MKLRTLTLGILSAVLLLSTAATAVSATTFLGPNFSVSNIAAGGTVPIALSVGSGSSLSSYPFCSTPGLSSCSFNVCPAVGSPGVLGGAQFEFYGIREVFITAPDGSTYQLGSSSRIFLADSSTVDGIGPVTIAAGYAPQLSLANGDSVTLPFGHGSQGPLNLGPVAAPTSSTWLGITPTYSTYTAGNEGPYYWWQTATTGGVSIPQTLLTSSSNPTSQVGVYHMDIEGNVFCTNGTTVPFAIDNFFDIGNLVFTATSSSSTTTTTSTTGVPQFPAGPAGMAAVMALAFVGIVAVKKRNPILVHA